MEVEMEDDYGTYTTTDVEFTFTAVEIDLDYEFEAARFFDFTREESTAEANEAEMWFDSAVTYPPSPFAAKLIPREDAENINISPKSKGFGDTDHLHSLYDVGRALEDSAIALSNGAADGTNGGVSSDFKNCYIQGLQNQHPTILKGLTSFGCTRDDNYKFKTNSSLKPSCPRASTLMKPTASQLAKQNQHRVVDHSRFQKLENYNSSGVESQAAKRQKLERGHLCKVADTIQQANLVHKAPKREGTVDGNTAHGRLRITVPRPPDLATAQRARRIRPKADSGPEHVSSTAPGFRALPLNRKILETPSLFHSKRSTPQLPEFQEFHLKTSERAMQSTTAVLSTSACCNNSKVSKKPSFAFVAESNTREFKRPQAANAAKQEDYETMHKFKALPLNKKIFSSKGDLGVYRNSKRETTVTTAFNFQTEKRAQHAPPIDLFNKLSLASEFKQDPGSHLKLPKLPSIFSKGSKENRACSFQQQSEIKKMPTGKLPRMGSKQVQFENGVGIIEGSPLSKISR